MWPMYDNIAFVRFRHATSKQAECVDCLMEHSEIFLLHTTSTNFEGYAWMRQAPSAILKLCLGKVCESLAYDGQQTQIRRSSRLLQLTKRIIPSDKRRYRSDNLRKSSLYSTD
uniref:AlNc14C315G10525 protein n=1 Tax=Albugo laibachii Nc14 TaxID=890382 RepID=F0WW83_9STRA|nr:AlNc14C315G10525 [Albugo laibachii Nc14]|eukprot:CCA25703.1 AlNc14C315G10525 [Albugo laibachii Nc14]